MTIDCTQIGGKVVLHLAGRMDAESAAHFEGQCNSCISEGITSLVVDLGDLSYVSSMGLRCFLSVAQKLQATSGSLMLCGLHGLPRQVFEMTRLIGLFPVFETAQQAISTL